MNVVSQSRSIGQNDNQFDMLHNAERLLVSADANAYMAASSITLELSGDNVHLSDAGYTRQGLLAGTVIGDVLEGNTPVSRGPVMSSVSRLSSTQFRIILNYAVGTSFLPILGATGFTLFDGSTPVTISSIDEDDGNIIFTHPTNTNQLSLRYQYGANPNISNPVVANDALEIPLEFGAVTVTTIVNNPPTIAIDQGDQSISDAQTLVLTASASDDGSNGI